VELSLVSKTVLCAAVRALPGDPIARHAPEIFLHTLLTDLESAPAHPAKRNFLIAAVANISFAFSTPL